MKNTAEQPSDVTALQALAATLEAETARLAKVQKRYDVELAAVREANPAFLLAETELSRLKDAVAQAKKTLSDTARKAREGVRHGRVSVTYNDPVTISYDASKLLETYPKASEIPNLFVTAVNSDVMECAVAAEFIPAEIAQDCKVETKTTANGKVTVKVLKKRT